MKAYAGGAKQEPPSEPAPVTPSPRAREQTAYTFSGVSEESSRVSKENFSTGPQENSGCPAVRKGFLGSSRGAGALYGDEGSREGDGGRTKKEHKADHDFEHLVALADPDMGIGGQVSLIALYRLLFGRISDNRFSWEGVFLRQKPGFACLLWLLLLSR